jgi:hypothetical protein
MASVQTAEKSPAAANPRAHWPVELQQEFEDNRFSPIVGSVLVSETDKVRVWHLMIPAGKRCTFHRHVLDYFWTCHSHGQARGYFEDGSITETVHFPGDTRHLEVRAGRVHGAQCREHRRHRPAVHHGGVSAQRECAAARARRRAAEGGVSSLSPLVNSPTKRAAAPLPSGERT